MPHWWKDTVTLYHQSKRYDEATNRNVTAWSRTALTDCCFNTLEAQAVSGTTLSLASGYIVRVPFKGAVLDIAPGDIVVKGEVSDEVSDAQGSRSTDLLSKYKPGCFTVRTFSDNTKARLAHYKLTGV